MQSGDFETECGDQENMQSGDFETECGDQENMQSGDFETECGKYQMASGEFKIVKSKQQVACSNFESGRDEKGKKKMAEHDSEIEKGSTSSRYVTKKIRTSVQNAVTVMRKEAESLAPNQRYLFASRFLQDHRLLELFEPVIGLPSQAVVKHAILENLKDGLEEVKCSNSGDKLAAKHSVLSMVVGKNGDLKQKGIACKMLKCHPRNLSYAASRRKRMAIAGSNIWALAGRKARSDRLDEETKLKVIQFWLNNTKVSPKYRDVRKKRSEAIQYLDIPQAELYEQFVEENPDADVGIRMFEYLKPSCIRKLKERNTCCCVKHEQAENFRKAFNSMRQKFHINCSCNCDVCAVGTHDGVCQAQKLTFCNVSTLWREMVCQKEEREEWHNLKCIRGDCEKCGKQKIPLYPKETDQNNEDDVKWQAYCYMDEKSRKGTSRRLRLVEKQTDAPFMLSAMFDHMKKFVHHNFAAHWQSKEFRRSIQSLRDDSVISVVDFAENYTLQPFKEVQSEHWNADQITILVHITLFKVNGKLQKTVHLYVSDDRSHDTHFVQHAFQLHLQWLKENGGSHMRYYLVWSDGCAAQFKSRRSFYFICRYHCQHGIRVQWNFFGSGHGKGEHDGEAAKAKQLLASEQRREHGIEIKGAHDACVVLRNKKSQVCRVYWEVKEAEIDRSKPFDVQPLPGVQSWHCVSSISPEDPTLLMVRPLSCFCSACINFEWQACESIQHCGKWTLKKLVPCAHAEGTELESETAMFANEVEELHDVIQFGDNFASFALPGNEEDVPYYVLACTREKHVLDQTVIDDYKNEHHAGDAVISAYYYQKLPSCHNKYKLLDDREVLVPVESVIGAKFPMKKINHRVKGASAAFALSDDVHEMLLGSLPEMVDALD